MHSQLKQLFEKNCHFTQLGLVEEVMDTIHTQSLTYTQTQKALENLFTHYQLKVEPVAFKYMGKDKTYAYARVQQQVTKVSGPEFKNNKVDQLMVFKQDGEHWKIWTIAILNIRYLG